MASNSCRFCGKTVGNSGALATHEKSCEKKHRQNTEEKINLLQNRIREVKDTHQLSEQEVHEIRNLVAEILTTEDQSFVHGRNTGANLATLKEAAKNLRTLDRSELLNLATNVGGGILGFMEGEKQFGEVREMLDKAQKYDELMAQQRAATAENTEEDEEEIEPIAIVTSNKKDEE